MSIFKCKMCGASLDIAAGTTVIECEYCGTQQTLPKLDDDKRANMYDRANHFRRNNEFDKAMGIYEQILNEDNTDAEAYWSLVLCRYGIEYVEDPSTKRRIPTVNRAQFTSIFDDEDYKSALKNSDTTQRSIYEAEAKAINEIQKGILAISQKEEPFDVFICYKESDNNGRRTPDSVLAQELYFGLKNEGFKVFFARITLEDKLGSAYEPYIFAALNSAKVMVVLGTKPEFFNAVWVKNEWSRYLALIKQGQKKMLIPAYKDMDPYDLPEEFSHLQAQDMSKLGFMQDLVRGIKKIVKADEPKQTVVKETVATTGALNTAPLLKRAFMFLEDGDWTSANEYCEKVLDMDPENARAYLGKLMADCKVKKQDSLKDHAVPFENNNNYQKAMRFADSLLQSELTGYIDHIKARNEDERKAKIYSQATNAMNSADTEQQYKNAASLFKSIIGYKDAEAMADKCFEEAINARKDSIYCSAKAHMIENKIVYYQEAIKLFNSIPLWKDSKEQIEICENKIEELQAKAEADRAKAEAARQEKARLAELARLERERQDEIKRQEQLRKAKIKRAGQICYWIFVVVAVAINCYFVYRAIKVPFYNSLVDDELYLGWWNVLWPCWLVMLVTRLITKIMGQLLFKNAKLPKMVMRLEGLALIVYVVIFSCYFPPNDTIFENIAGDVLLYFIVCIVPVVVSAIIGKFINKRSLRGKIVILIIICFIVCASLLLPLVTQNIESNKAIAMLEDGYNKAVAMMEDGSYKDAIIAFEELDGYKDSSDKIAECKNVQGQLLIMAGDYKAAINDYEIKDIIIPDGTIEIKENAFSDTVINSITIPDSVTSIGEYAFSNCTIRNITIPNSVTSIGAYAFSESSINSISIGDSVQSIGDSAFYQCTSLQEVRIPDSVTNIGKNAFYNCCSLTTVTLGNGVTQIDDNTFAACFYLESVIIGNNVKSIGNTAFLECSNLKSIVLPEGVTNIGSEAFYNCLKLSSVTIPNTVTSIGNSAFKFCKNIGTATIPEVALGHMPTDKIEVLNITDGLSSDIRFKSFSKLRKLTISGNITSIPEGVFKNCLELCSVVIGDSVTNIGRSAFEGCEELFDITIGSGVTSIGAYAFKDCSPGILNVTLNYNGTMEQWDTMIREPEWFNGLTLLVIIANGPSFSMSPPY